MVVNLGPQLRAFFSLDSRGRPYGTLCRGAAESNHCDEPCPATCLTRIKQSAFHQRSLRLGTNKENLCHVGRAENYPV